MMHDRKLFSKRDIALVVVLLIIAGGIWMYMTSSFTPAHQARQGMEYNGLHNVFADKSPDISSDNIELSEDETYQYMNDYPHLFAEIFFERSLVKSVPLHIDGTFSVPQNPNVVFEVRDGAIAFLESNCPDQICVRVGFLNSPWHFAACLPNFLLLTIAYDRGRTLPIDTSAR